MVNLQLRTFASYKRIVAVRHRQNEVVNVRLATSFFDLFLRDVLRSSQSNIKSHASIIQRRLLRNKGDTFSHALDVEVADILAINLDLTADRIVEALD